jgi:NAD(P)H-hydrate repair Nnr-like enzyme with NAD(P)H-hydrate epimerase domain
VADLLEALERVARSGRVGQPVFLRCQVTAPPERAVAALAAALAAAVAVLDDAPEPSSLQAWGDEAAGPLQVVLLHSSGSSVLAYSGPGNETSDALLLGNHGAAYGATAPCLLSGGSASGAAALEQQFVGLIRRSLAMRQAVIVEPSHDA